MLVTIEGMYKDGKIDLAESPQGVDGAKVIVTFLPPENPNVGRMLKMGQFAGPIMSTEDDFKIAEWHVRRKRNEVCAGHPHARLVP